MKTEVSRGERLRDVIKQSGMTVSFIASKLKITRSTIHTWMNDDELDFKKIKKIGDVINYDFSKDFPEMKSEAPWLISSNTNERIIELEKQLKFWQDQFYQQSMRTIELESLVKRAETNLMIAAEEEVKYERTKGA